MQSSAPYRPNSSSRQQAADASEASDHCPFLGTASDAGTSHEFPSDVNKCYSTRLAVPVSTIHQENYCLSPQFEGCPVYRERAKRANGASVVPLSVVASAAANSPLAWPETIADHDLESISREPSVSEPEAAPDSANQPLASGAPLLFPWEEQAHPDFQADLAAASNRRQSRRISLRPVLIGLLLLALIPLAWWLWNTVRPGSGSEAESAQGTVVTLPTLMATSVPSDAADGRGAGSDVGQTTTDPESVAGAVAANPTAEPTAEPTATDLEKIAATATALFINATPVTDCVAPSWWVSYLVEEGDTIEGLALMRGIPPEELIVANCLAGPELEPGLTLLLPPVGVIALQPEASPTPTAIATRATRVSGLPTRAPILFPTPTFPIVIILTPQTPIVEPTDEPDSRPPARPTNAPVQPTATPPNPFAQATATPPTVTTSTPPSINGTATATTTMTPPAPGP